MNLRNTYLVTTLRIIFGLFMIFSGVSGLVMGPNAEGIPAAMVEPTRVFWETGIFQLIKITEAVAGLMLVLNFLPALAAIFIAPIAAGVIVFNARVAPPLVITGVILALFEAYFGHVYWDQYKALFQKR